MTDPNGDQITQAQTNINNMTDWIRDFHDFAQDKINTVFGKISESPAYDPSQGFITSMLNGVFAVTGSLDFPGAGVISSFLSSFFGNYSSDTPPDLSKTFSSIWDRFGTSLTPAIDDLGIIYKNIKADWNKKYTNPVTGNDGYVYQLGDGEVKMPSKNGDDQDKFNEMRDRALTAFEFNLAKETLHINWCVVDDLRGQFVAANSENELHDFIHKYVADHLACQVVNNGPDTGGSACKPVPGYTLIMNTLGSSRFSSAPDDLCNWLFQDDGWGTVLNTSGLALRNDVFTNWGLEHIAGAERSSGENVPTITKTLEAERLKASQWLALFDQTPRQEVKKQIIQRALQDADFSNSLIKDPKKALEAFSKITVPDSVDVEVISETANTYKLVVPMHKIANVSNGGGVENTSGSDQPKDFQSMMYTDLNKRLEVEKKIILQAQKDPNFLNQLLDNPKKSLETFLGVPFPGSIEAEVLQETIGNYKLVLPRITH